MTPKEVETLFEETVKTIEHLAKDLVALRARVNMLEAKVGNVEAGIAFENAQDILKRYSERNK